uniref:Lipase domain-containing protein n=1 Tax=Soboliphyme baturini TaxID=241478 RepID=A0A183J7K0_9BILA
LSFSLNNTVTEIYDVSPFTGLDPAGPLFSRRPPTERLSDTDAKVVKCIHTDSDFGTEDAYFASLLKEFTCSHSLAHVIYLQSIQNYSPTGDGCKFLALPCFSAQQFQTGKCFTCGPASDFPIIGYNGRAYTNYKTGKYFFGTTNNVKDLCGK